MTERDTLVSVAITDVGVDEYSAKNLEKNRLFVEYFQFKRKLNFQILNFYVILNSNFLLKKIIL